MIILFGEVDSEITEIDYNIEDKNNILDDNKVTVSKSRENSIDIEIGEVKNSEIYLYVSDIQYTPYTKQEMIELEVEQLDEYSKVEEEKIKTDYKWYEESYDYTINAEFNKVSTSKKVADKKSDAYYFENNEMLLNLGYYDEASGTIKIIFSEIGVYDISNIQIFAVSMDGYDEDINNLRRSNFETTEYGNGYMVGTVNVEEDGILQFTTMYNKGWKVYVDGEEVDTLISNEYFLGIYINNGEHTISMEYSTPYLKVGIVISIIGLLMFGAISYISKKKKD